MVAIRIKLGLLPLKCRVEKVMEPSLPSKLASSFSPIDWTTAAPARIQDDKEKTTLVSALSSNHSFSVCADNIDELDFLSSHMRRSFGVINDLNDLNVLPIVGFRVKPIFHPRKIVPAVSG